MEVVLKQIDWIEEKEEKEELAEWLEKTKKELISSNIPLDRNWWKREYFEELIDELTREANLLKIIKEIRR